MGETAQADGKLHPIRALVLSGGVGLGAYQAGAYEALHEDGRCRPTWLVGASTGAVMAALIAGNPPERRLERLRRFWDGVASEAVPVAPFVPPWLEPAAHGPWRAANNWANALQAQLLGRPGMFRPRVPAVAGSDDAPGVYDLAPLRAGLAESVDFGRLNGGDPRVSVVMTDVVTGERVVLDTGRGDRIEPDHVLASSALMPLFAPVEVDGRLLGDGGFVANTPLDLVLDEPAPAGMSTVCFAVDLFAREGSRPRSLLAAVARAADLVFGNQTHQLLRARRREHRLRAALGRLAERLPPEALDELRADPDVAAAVARDGRYHRLPPRLPRPGRRGRSREGVRLLAPNPRRALAGGCGRHASRAARPRGHARPGGTRRLHRPRDPALKDPASNPAPRPARSAVPTGRATARRSPRSSARWQLPCGRSWRELGRRRARRRGRRFVKTKSLS